MRVFVISYTSGGWRGGRQHRTSQYNPSPPHSHPKTRQRLVEHARHLAQLVGLVSLELDGHLVGAFEPADALRYNVRTVAERANARLKDEFGGRYVMVRGAAKVREHLMLGILALSADQLMRLRQ